MYHHIDSVIFFESTKILILILNLIYTRAGFIKTGKFTYRKYSKRCM